MTDRLSALDVSFLYLEGPTTPMHLGNLAVFDPPAGGLDYARLVGLIQERIAQVPRYRQKVAWIPGHLANPVWVDDPDFDVSYHVRRSGLPKPGSDEQLREFCARIQSRPLDRRRSLWEMYLIEGLAGGRIAIATKTHYAMVDGIDAIDLEQVILDHEPTHHRTSEPAWTPRPLATSGELFVDAVTEIIRRPAAALDAVRLSLSDARSVAGRATSMIGGAFSAVRAVIAPPSSSPLNVAIGERRRFSVVRTQLSDFRRVHAEQDVTVNDVVLATIAGALRGWLLLRGVPVQQSTGVRVMAPVGVGPEDAAREPGTDVSPLFVQLPVGEANPLVRLSQIAFATRSHADSGRAIGAQALAALSGFAPPTLHAMGARLASGLSHRLYGLLVINVPGPQSPRYAAGARMIETFPIVPLAVNQALAIGVTSYDGGVYFGLNADSDSMPDLDTLAGLIDASLAELVAASAAANAGAVRVNRTATVTDVRGRQRGPSTVRSKTARS